jgi:uncharacterized membrane protein YjfL (UPF0719 family)
MLLDRIITAVVLVIVFYVLFFVGKIVHDGLQRGYRLTYELVERDNVALALAVAGYYFGLVLALGGAIVGDSAGIVEDLIDMLIYGLLSIILLNLSWFICDKLLLSKFKVTDELIRDQNPGTGAVCFAVSVATGLIVFGAISGEGGNIWTAIAFWGIGQLMLILASVMYNFITPYDIHAEIEKDNIAAGVSFSGALIAMGIILGLAAEGDFFSWRQDVPKYLVIAALGLVMLPPIRFLTDKVLLPTVKLTDEIANQERSNVGAAFIEAFSYIAAAFIIVWCV